PPPYFDHWRPLLELKRLLKGSLVALALWRGHIADEIGECRAKGELGTVGILELELIVANNPGTVQNAARAMCVRTQGPVDVDDRRGAVRFHIIDDQGGTGIGVPGGIGPSTKK